MSDSLAISATAATEPPRNTRIDDLRWREHRTAQSVRPGDVNRPLMTFAGSSAVIGCGTVQPRRSTSVRTSAGRFCKRRWRKASRRPIGAVPILRLHRNNSAQEQRKKPHLHDGSVTRRRAHSRDFRFACPGWPFIHPRASEPTRLCSSHHRPGPNAVTPARADVSRAGGPCFQGIPSTPLLICVLALPSRRPCTRRASACRDR